ncbi:hypothetical protein KSP39_PZI018068 [Platanthera zijinensis]|uniref:F-box domain-containing protein n=1 Tax=Platanthera zijinensis TaxID=2320716 RepID=A0AAP0B3J2_9ASPA
MAAEKRDYQLDGDNLDSVLSHVPTADLLQVTRVSRSWRRSVVATINRRHHRPWLLIHLLNTRRRAGVSTAYDPYTGSWRILQQPHVTPSPHITFPFLSLALPLQPLASTWPILPLPRVHRRDAVVSLVGSHLVLAGGVCDLGERTCEVESLSLHPAGSNWKNCRPMPESLRVSASATWLSVAASDSRMYVMERGAADAGRLAWYEPAADRWGAVRPVRFGGRALHISAIGMAPASSSGEDRLFVVGLVEDGMLEIWEVEPESLDGRRIGSLPAEVAERIAGEGAESSSAVGFSNLGSFGFLYNLNGRGEILACDLGVGKWSWEEIGRPPMLEEDPTARVVFGCARPTLGHLKEVYR